ncbi:N-terminal kinase-like protein [Skeletonema marinoi]|uniref:N-terminal kinase-like protein n=1 Tax=Skeletonema marinoi TaxID=267567 RepID=A0AAD9DBM1_9STRA|nr:N-terminal kinase-like protein [Skeletonema marinoi]
MASWLGSLWGGSGASSLPYNISTDPLSPSTNKGSHGWAIHTATHKTNGEEATAFQASKAELAKTPLQQQMSQSFASSGSGNLTQLVPALHHFHRIKRLIHPRILRAHATLDTDYPDDSKPSPGLDALDKVASTGNLIIVTEKAIPLDDWLDNLNPHTPKPMLPRGRYDTLQQSAPLHSIDCYSLAVLIEYIYTHPSAGTNGQVPVPLKKALLRMKNDSPKLRPRLPPLLKCPVFDNPYVKAQKFLDEVVSKPVEEKIIFLQSLPDILNRGILPMLVMGLRASAGNEAAMSQDINRREVLAISYLAKTPELFQKHVTPLVPLLFAVNDRGVRGSILQKISILESQLDKSALNSSVFEPMCSGFTDSSGPLRELTLKSTIVLVPKLNHANLEKLVRYLVRLQADPEASIRTNTVIFIGKVAPHLTETSRQKLILPAFTRSMKDPFTPCRLAALRAVIACKEYFSQKEVAEKVLPCVIPHTLDGANEVRAEAFNVRIEENAKDEAERMSAATCGIGAEGGTGGATSAAPSSGSYLTGISSWMGTTPGPAAPKFSSLTLSDAQVGGSSKYNTADDSGAGGGGWDDDDDAFGMSPVNKTKGDGDFFASFDSNKASKVGGGKAGSLKPGMKLKGKAKPTVTSCPRVTC